MSIVGIDLGTTNSLVSVFRNGKIEQIPNSFGEILTPSAVSFDEDGTVYVGKIAKERKITGIFPCKLRNCSSFQISRFSKRSD